MKKSIERNLANKTGKVWTAKDCAFLAVFVALLIAVQTALSILPGVELVTVLFVSFSFVFGVKKGMLSATAFSLLRQFVFGFFPTVLILYLFYFNFLTFLFGSIGRKRNGNQVKLWGIVLIACLCTTLFTLFDNVLTPLWYGYSAHATKLYFYASLPVLIPQVICTAVSVGILFTPLRKVFEKI